MTKKTLRLAASLLIVPVMLCGFNAVAAPAKKSKTRVALSPVKRAAPVKTAPKTQTVPSGRYLPLATLKQMHRARRSGPIPVLQPTWEGHAIKRPMRDLLTNPSFDVPVVVPVKNQKARGADPTRLAQAFPRPIAPASPRNFRPANTVPRWVRYPLEFQLAGIGLGTRAVDKDRFNRIDRYGLFALHGNPTAVVRSIGGTSVVTGGEGGAPPTGEGVPGGAAAAPAGGVNLTMPQTPPEAASLFPQVERGGGLPGWALAVTVKLDNNHVQWLYNRGTYSMGFVVDRLGFVDAIIVAGIESDITRTQLEDPVHTVKLGDDLRKVLFRYGYPDDIVPLASDPAATANDTTGAPGAAAAGAAGAAAGPAGGEGAAGAEGGITADAAGTNGAFRTFDLRYEQSYNVVFTIRNNRVVRVYIFGDPDFFNAQRRYQLRTRY
ncbi:MAG: hypothetical protein KY445_05595 [Armatimonadetes bacterium]|nr:hypothetical protein [Armatimonadota bacterium]